MKHWSESFLNGFIFGVAFMVGVFLMLGLMSILNQVVGLFV